MKNVIHIFGPSGSGTTTLGEKNCQELGFTLMDTDDYFWMPTDPKFTTKRPAAERLSLMDRDMKEWKNLVISDSLTDWGGCSDSRLHAGHSHRNGAIPSAGAYPAAGKAQIRLPD